MPTSPRLRILMAVLGIIGLIDMKDTPHNTVAAAETDQTLSPMRSFIEQDSADFASLDRRYPIAMSDKHRSRFEQFDKDESTRLATVDFQSLDRAGRIDYLLLAAKLRFDGSELARRHKQWVEAAPLLPFAEKIVTLCQNRVSTGTLGYTLL